MRHRYGSCKVVGMRVQVLMLFFIFSSLASAKPGDVLSFKDWKRGELQKATEQLVSINGKIAKENQLLNSDSSPHQGAQDQEIKQKEWNYELAKDLSIKDYLVLYVSTLTQANKFNAAAEQLSLDEIAEVLQHYSGVAPDPAAPATVSKETPPLAKLGK